MENKKYYSMMFVQAMIGIIVMWYFALLVPAPLNTLGFIGIMLACISPIWIIPTK